MKKVMFAAAVAAAGLAFGIESANTVGYATVPSISDGQYVALGVQFENCAGGAIPVKDLVTVGSPTGSGNIGNSDQIWRWNTSAASWTKYFYNLQDPLFYWFRLILVHDKYTILLPNDPKTPLSTRLDEPKYTMYTMARRGGI